MVVLDERGRRLDQATFPTTTRGYRDLTGWVAGFGEVLALGVEGTWGAGLSRHLRARGLNLVEVNQPDRKDCPRWSGSASAERQFWVPRASNRAR